MQDQVFSIAGQVVKPPAAYVDAMEACIRHERQMIRRGDSSAFLFAFPMNFRTE